MAAATKATPTLAERLAQRAPEPTDTFSTLGLNRQSGYIRERDPYWVGNMPSGYIACAFSRMGGQLTQARMAGWIPFEPDQVSRNEYDTDKAFIADYDVDNGFVVIGFGHEAMVMCFANKTIVERGRARMNVRWNEQFGSRLGTNEEPSVRPKKDTGYTGGFTTDSGNQTIVGYEETSVQINPDDPTSDLFRQPEGGQ
jgi:hypothetical protein